MPVVAVIFQGKEWRLRVPPTAAGARQFRKQIEQITGLPFDAQVGRGGRPAELHLMLKTHAAQA